MGFWSSITGVGKKMINTFVDVGKNTWGLAKKVGKVVYEGAREAHHIANKILPVLGQAKQYIRMVPGIGDTINRGIDVATDLNKAFGDGLGVIDNKILPQLNPVENYNQIPLRLANLADGSRELDRIRQRAAYAVR